MSYTSKMLYKLLPSGAMRQWRSWSQANEVYTEFGQVNGKLQTSRDVVKGKNINRANATTPYEQAALEAEHLWDAMVKKGYVVDKKKAAATQNSLPAILPMLAHVYEDVKEPTYPAYVQPKLDGIRCIAIIENGKAKLYTRSQKIIDTVPHINAALEQLSSKKNVPYFTLDGELYNHKFSDDFGRILGAVKRKGVGEDSELVHYYIYDNPSDLPFETRIGNLDDLLNHQGPPLVFVETVWIATASDLKTYAKFYVDKGYEGVMYRSANGLYEGKRSKHLLKVKVMRDDEFKVTGFQEGTGKLMGRIGSFHCVTKKGVAFKAKLEGALDKLPDVMQGKEFVGKMLTVRYQGLTPDGALRFPVGVKFKDAVEA